MLDEKSKVMLGGFKQKIHIKSKDEKLPVLLFLHGGPGVTNRHSVMQDNDYLLDYFTIVAWDQRGTAGSYWGVKKEDLTVDRLCDDAGELVDYLCKRFNKKKIFAIGGSWGSSLGISLIKKHPEHIAAFIGFGQVVDGEQNEILSYQFCLDEAKKANNEKDLKALKELGYPVMGVYKGGFKGMMTQRNIMMKYGGYSQDAKRRNYWDSTIKPILLSGEYSLSDIIGYIKGYKLVLTCMWPEIGVMDFKKTHTKFNVPLFIFDGRLDKNTPAELVQEWFDMIEAPVKELHWFENSAHNPMNDEGEAFRKLMIEKLLPIAKKEGI